jgi:YD repeat-containing protein
MTRPGSSRAPTTRAARRGLQLRCQRQPHWRRYVVGPNNQVLADGTFTYAYDAEGNLVLKTEVATGQRTEFEYDFRNRLVRATTYSAGGIALKEVGYTYDVFDRQIRRTVDRDGAGPQAAETTAMVYDGEHVWADYDAAGAVLARYLFGATTDGAARGVREKVWPGT